MDAVLGEVTIEQRRKKLQEMERGNGLSDAYTATLRRLKDQKGNMARLGLRALMWVLCSERPLRAEELCHALSVEIGSADLDWGSVPSTQTVLSSCLGLLTVAPSSSTVRLVHSTLREHLSSSPTLFDCPHSTIAEVCLTYLNFRFVRNLSPNLRSAPSAMPLLEYASVYWGEHTRRGMTENVKILALLLLDRFSEHISAQLLLLWHEQHNRFGPEFGGGGPVGFTGLHGGAYFGIVEVVATGLEMKEWDANASDCMGSTALAWAAYMGREEVVKILLEREDVNPNHPGAGHGWTPLTLAAGSGHEGVVKLLLERDGVDPNQTDTFYYRTPLSWGAGAGHEVVAKILLERHDVNPNQTDTFNGRTPLSWAAKCGHEGVVKALLQRTDVNPDQAETKSGRTPLSWAAKGGHEGIVKMLLEQNDVNPVQTDTKYGRTPLSWAVERRHEAVVKLFLELDDVRTAVPEDQDQAPPPPATPPKGPDALIDTPPDPAFVNSYAADRSGPADLPPPTALLSQGPVAVHFSSDDPDADIAVSKSQPPLPSECSVKLEPVSELKDSILTSPNNGLPAKEKKKRSLLLQLLPCCF